MLALIAASLLSSTSCPTGVSLAGGHHSKVVTTQGPVHLWCRGDRELTSVVVYVHGYWDTADSAFDGHQLAQQFAASQLDALFVVVEAPSGPKQNVVVTDLDAMLSELKISDLPRRTLLIGHSGGNRTLKQWLRSDRARDVVLLDGLYGSTKEWTEWLGKNGDARLALVSQHTAPQADQFMKTAPRAQVSNTAAGCSHMAIVKGGEWLVRELRAFGSRDSRS
ncbi:MAG: hypothetical protein JNM17_08885 [Archangium sp.]|nr:hypothetical protein [Archangium sp.]